MTSYGILATLAQVMAFRLVGIIWTKADLMSVRWLGTNLNEMWIYNDFHSQKCIRKCRLQNVGHHDDVIQWKHFRIIGHLCGEITGQRWIPSQRPVTRSFDVFFDLRPNKLLSKQSWCWWFETLSRPLWRHCNVSGLNFLTCVLYACEHFINPG